MRKEILVFTNYYIPGFKGGGPIRTISNMVEALREDFKFSLFTLDRDLGDKVSYDGVESNKWKKLNFEEVFYCSKNSLFLNITKIIYYFKGDILNLNSFFSFWFSIFPLIVAKLIRPDLKIVLGPRGEFSSGAMGLKSFKKNKFIKFANKIGLYRGVVWHASTAEEKNDIVRVMGNVDVRIAIDISLLKNNNVIKDKNSSRLKIIFLSRISPVKNIKYALDVLKFVKIPVAFDVYGPIEDAKYWSDCKQIASELPKNIEFNYFGEVKPNKIIDVFSDYDLFFFPTMGENYGHVIAEAFYAGVPVLLSDKTPWHDLDSKGLGWDLSLSQSNKFVECIEECYYKSDWEYKLWKKKICAWGIANIGSAEAIEQNRNLFIGIN